MNIEMIDHLVLTVKDINVTCEFYSRVLGMKITTFGSNRIALSFGAPKINFHQYGQEIEPKAKKPTPGSADLCFIAATPIPEIIEHLNMREIAILEGPVQ